MLDQTTKSVPPQTSQGTPFNPPTINTVKVQHPSEPPPEMLKGTFTSDDSLFSSDGDRVVVEDKLGNVAPIKEVNSPSVTPNEPTKVEDKKESSKSEDKPAPEEKSKDELGRFIKAPKKEGDKKE